MAIKQSDLQEWGELEQKRMTLQREAKTVTDRQKQLETQFEAELRKSGKKVLKRGGYTLAMQPGRASVPWAKAYLAALGPDAVQQLKDESAKTSTEVFVILPPEPPKE